MISKISKILSIPLSLYVCLRLLPFKYAIRIPLLIQYGTSLKRLTGRIILEEKHPKVFGIQIGFTENNLFDSRADRCILDISGILHFKGTAILGKGTRISINPHGKLRFGNQFYNSAKMQIVCNNCIEIGDDCIISWDTLIMDTDLHETKNTRFGSINNKDGYIYIGHHVWLAARATILKDTRIGNGCIVGAGALVSGDFNEDNTLIAGVPASVRKYNIALNK